MMKESASLRGRRLRSLASKPTTSTSRNSRSRFARATRIALPPRLRRLQDTRVKSTAGELADPLQQSHLMQRQLTLRSRLMFVMSALTTISYFHEDGNDGRRGRLCRTGWRKSLKGGVEGAATIRHPHLFTLPSREG